MLRGVYWCVFEGFESGLGSLGWNESADQHIEDVVEDFIGCAGGVYAEVALGGWIAGDEVVVALADFGVEGGALGFHAVEEGVEAGGGGILVDIEDEGGVGLGGLHGDFGGFVDLGFGDASCGALVGVGGGDEAVGDDEVALVEGGFDELLAELGAGGHVEEHLAAEGHGLAVEVVEEGVADFFSDFGASWLADFGDFDACVADGFEEHGELCGFA